jgi:hypothetical protein
VVRADPEGGVVLRDHHLGVLRRERLPEERGDFDLDLPLVVDELVEALRGARGGLDEVLVERVVAELADAFDDLLVALLEEGEGPLSAPWTALVLAEIAASRLPPRRRDASVIGGGHPS